MNNPYRILGIKEDATEKEIKAAYKKLAKKYHPDVGGDENKFKEINAAYAELTKPNTQNTEQGFGGFGGFDFTKFFDESIFNSIFRQFRTTIALDVSIFISGGSFTYAYQTAENGRPVQKTAQLRIEPDTPVGTQIVVPGTQPNLILQLTPNSNSKYHVHEHVHLVENVKLSVFTAMTGGLYETTTPFGKKISLNIPPGTQNESIFRIPQGGLRLANGVRGDFHISFDIDIPAITGTDDEIKTKILQGLKG